jgi:hypothetical protein
MITRPARRFRETPPTPVGARRPRQIGDLPSRLGKPVESTQ